MNAPAGKVFVDTNILVYAHDLNAGTKRHRAATELKRLWESQTGVLSIQVLQEFYVTVTKKVRNPISREEAMGLIEEYGKWEITGIGVDEILKAVDLERRHKFHFWDALIVQAALASDCTQLLSEDFQHGQKIESLAVRNPFALDPSTEMS